MIAKIAKFMKFLCLKTFPVYGSGTIYLPEKHWPHDIIQIYIFKKVVDQWLTSVVCFFKQIFQ